MKILNILLIILLGIYLIIGGIKIHHIHTLYNNPVIPHYIYTRAIYPYELFEGLCLVAAMFSLNRWLKGSYKTGVYIAFAAILLSALFFALYK